ncbi:MAG: hypothetical protein PVI86_01120 [Phycisphaerae bacterium]
MLALLLGVAMLPVIGCVFSVDVREFPYRKQVVAVEGQLYVVDLKTNCVRKLDPVWETGDRTGETTTTTEVIVEED